MKALKSKSEERREIENQIQSFLQSGGQIEAIAQGTSGRELGTYALPPVSFQKAKEPRTLLLEEVRAIEARKHKSIKPLPRRQKPKRVLITDDFGEPLRWAWEER